MQIAKSGSLALALVVIAGTCGAGAFAQEDAKDGATLRAELEAQDIVAYFRAHDRRPDLSPADPTVGLKGRAPADVIPADLVDAIKAEVGSKALEGKQCFVLAGRGHGEALLCRDKNVILALDWSFAGLSLYSEGPVVFLQPDRDRWMGSVVTRSWLATRGTPYQAPGSVHLGPRVELPGSDLDLQEAMKATLRASKVDAFAALADDARTRSEGCEDALAGSKHEPVESLDAEVRAQIQASLGARALEGLECHRLARTRAGTIFARDPKVVLVVDPASIQGRTAIFAEGPIVFVHATPGIALEHCVSKSWIAAEGNVRAKFLSLGRKIEFETEGLRRLAGEQKVAAEAEAKRVEAEAKRVAAAANGDPQARANALASLERLVGTFEGTLADGSRVTFVNEWTNDRKAILWRSRTLSPAGDVTFEDLMVLSWDAKAQALRARQWVQGVCSTYEVAPSGSEAILLTELEADAGKPEPWRYAIRFRADGLVYDIARKTAAGYQRYVGQTLVRRVTGK